MKEIARIASQHSAFLDHSETIIGGPVERIVDFICPSRQLLLQLGRQILYGLGVTRRGYQTA